jgi:hypothetical protein
MHERYGVLSHDKLTDGWRPVRRKHAIGACPCSLTAAMTVIIWIV